MWTLDQRLYDLPRASRIATRREVRHNLVEAANNVGGREAILRLGDSRQLAAAYVAAEFGDGPRHSWLANRADPIAPREVVHFGDSCPIGTAVLNYQALIEFAGANITSSFMVLTDLRKYPVQHPEVTDMHAAKLAEVQQNSPVVRQAWVVAGVVSKMQATRGAESGVQEINMFTDCDAAWTYLTSTIAA